MSDKRGASIGRFRLQHTHTHTRREGGREVFTALTPQPGFRQPNSPAPCGKRNHGGLPLPNTVFPDGGGPSVPPRPSVSLYFLGGVRSSLGKGLCLQPHPAATSSGAGKVCECLQPGGGTGAPREGNNPPGRVGVSGGGVIRDSCSAEAASSGEKS